MAEDNPRRGVMTAKPWDLFYCCCFSVSKVDKWEEMEVLSLVHWKSVPWWDSFILKLLECHPNSKEWRNCNLYKRL